MAKKLSLALAAALALTSAGARADEDRSLPSEPSMDRAAPADQTTGASQRKQAADPTWNEPLPVEKPAQGAPDSVGTQSSQGAQGTSTSRDQSPGPAAPGTGVSGTEGGVQGTSSSTSATSVSTDKQGKQHLRKTPKKRAPQGGGEVIGKGTHVGDTGRP